MTLSFPLWAVLIAVIAVAVTLTSKDYFLDDQQFSIGPLLGCGIVLVGVIGVLLVLLVKAWGWL